MKKFLLILLSVTMFFAVLSCGKQPEIKEDEPVQKQEEKMIQQEVSFYYPDEAVMYLCPEKIMVNTRESEFLESIVQTVIKGPVSAELTPAVSGEVDVLSVTLKNGVCTVDLSEDFATYNTGGSTKETMAIYSIVNTLCGVDGVEKVKININGNENPDFGGHFDLSEPFEANLSLIKNI